MAAPSGLAAQLEALLQQLAGSLGSKKLVSAAARQAIALRECAMDEQMASCSGDEALVLRRWGRAGQGPLSGWELRTLHVGSAAADIPKLPLCKPAAASLSAQGAF